MAVTPRTAATAAATPVTPGGPLFAVTDLQIDYGGIKTVRGEVSFQAFKGQLVTLTGANGAGKSTTLRAISGLVSVAGGEVRFMADDLRCYSRSPENIAALGIAHVPEGRGIFVNLTVHENLRLAMYLRRDLAGLKDDPDRVFSIFQRLRGRKRQMGWFSQAANGRCSPSRGCPR